MSSNHPFNILITGTPGTGKTTISERIVEQYGLTDLPVSSIAKATPSIQDHWNPDIQAYELTEEDENAVCSLICSYKFIIIMLNL